MVYGSQDNPLYPKEQHFDILFGSHPFMDRRKTAEEKKAEAARKADLAASTDPTTSFSLGQRQPWANKVAEVRE